MNIDVQKSDIKHIGHTMYGDDNGNLIILCHCDTAGIEQILLRSILRCFGDYMITEEFDADENFYQIGFRTNLPFSIYEETCH